MKTLKHLILITALLLPALSFGQQQAMFTHYMFNTMSFNPAYAASKSMLSATLISRKQWWGFDGAPTSHTLNVYAPVKQHRLGLGVSVSSDRIGPLQEHGAFLDFAFAVPITSQHRLSFGFKGGMTLFNAEFNEVSTYTANDPAYLENIENTVLPNAGFGLFFYTDKYYLGASIPRLMRNSITDNKTVSTGAISEEERHYYLMGGYVFDVSRTLKIKPAFIGRLVEGSPMSFEVSSNFYIRDRLGLGAAYRFGDALSAMVQYGLTKQLWAGYAYGYSASKIRHFNNGTHEIMLSYGFMFDKFKIKSPRYF